MIMMSDYGQATICGDQYFRYVSPKICIKCMVMIMILNVMIARLIRER